MTLNIDFTVTMRCAVYENSSTGLHDESYKTDIDFRFTRDDALNFLFKFTPQSFKLGDYKLLFAYNASHMVTGVTLYYKSNVYVVTNVNQVINDVYKGLLYLEQMDKVVDIMDFDFKAGLEFNTNGSEEIEDEFGE